MTAARTTTRCGPTSNPEPTTARHNPDGHSQVEHELAILVRRAHANAGDLSREAHRDLQAPSLPGCTPWARRPTDLSDHLGIDKGARSGQLTPLENLQLITSQTDTADPGPTG